MKKFIICLLTLLFFTTMSGLAFSQTVGPYLVCDPLPADNQDNFILVIDGVSYSLLPEDLGDGTERMKFDLGDAGLDLSEGLHNVTVKAVNMWGESDPVPFSFTKKLPEALQGLGLEQ